MRQHSILIVYLQFLLTLIWYSSLLKFQFQSISIDNFQKTAAKMPMHLQSCPNYLICSVISPIIHHIFCLKSVSIHSSVSISKSVIICVICG